jgi:alpha-glucoside transport system substrate-binding protein
MFNRKIWSFMIALIVVAMIAVACGPSPTATPSPTTETAMEEPTEAMEEPTEAMEEPTEAMEEPTEAMEEPTEAMEEPTEAMEEPMEEIGGTVSVLATWGGEELDNFMAMIAPFEEQTGITIEFEGTRDLNAVLTTRIEGGNPPDLAGLPGPGQLIEYAEAGHLVPLDEILDMDKMRAEYDEGFLNLATVDNNLYGIFIKAAVKSLVWYNPNAFDAAGYEVPTTWDELNALEDQIIADGTTPWCIGLESGAASGWPGTDWIEDIMLRTAGPETYDQWWQHEIPWTDDVVRNAWETWGTVVNDPEMVYGGQPFVLSTNFGEAPFPMFEQPPNCYLHRQASFITSFITDQYPDLVAGEDYNFFEFPPIDPDHGQPLLVAGDLFGMFNDTPQSRALLNYLVTADAQSIWAERGGFLSANKTVDPAVYPDQLTRQIGEMLTQATSVRFDASDLMPEAVNNAFWAGILDFVSQPDSLDSVLESIESAAQDAY